MKTASALEKACEAAARERPLKVMIQVLTSGEESKSGCKPSEAVDIARHIVHECPRLSLSGLMTIGKFGDPNPEPYFELLKQCRAEVRVGGRPSFSAIPGPPVWLSSFCLWFRLCAEWKARACTFPPALDRLARAMAHLLAHLKCRPALAEFQTRRCFTVAPADRRGAGAGGAFI